MCTQQTGRCFLGSILPAILWRWVHPQSRWMRLKSRKQKRPQIELKACFSSFLLFPGLPLSGVKQLSILLLDFIGRTANTSSHHQQNGQWSHLIKCLHNFIIRGSVGNKTSQRSGSKRELRRLFSIFDRFHEEYTWISNCTIILPVSSFSMFVGLAGILSILNLSFIFTDFQINTIQSRNTKRWSSPCEHKHKRCHPFHRSNPAYRIKK